MFDVNRGIFHNKRFSKFVFLFIIVNVFFFVLSNTRPIFWLQDEMTCYRFYWSMDDIQRLTLHTGLTLEDFKKPFVSRFTVGAFRLRQVSSLLEMLSFKAGQLWNGEYFRDYFLIFLHLLNVFLFGALIRKWSGSVHLAWIAAMLALNSGASLATLLFPFRLAKILVVTFFLAGFYLIAASPVRFDRAKTSILVSFFLIVICGFFTDESFVLLLPVYCIYLGFYQGREVFFSKRLWRHVFAALAIILVLGTGFYFYSRQFDGNNVWHQSYFGNFSKYYSNLLTMKDLARSFGLFLQRNFGYWEFSATGVASAVSFAVLGYFVASAKRAGRERTIALLIILCLLGKNLLMPHMTVFPYLMPADAFFPSMLYFAYYYVYIESFLFILALAVLLFSYRDNARILLVMINCVALINFSNVVNAPRGITDALKFHALNFVGRKDIVDNMQELKRVLAHTQQRPFYLSFPAGDESLINGRFGFDKSWPIYTAYVLTMFLPELENGAGIVSLKNVPNHVRACENNELLCAKSFYDVVSKQVINLEALKDRYGLAQTMPYIVAGAKGKEIVTDFSKINDGDIIFFVKGKAEIIFQLDEVKARFEQTYGESYQLFWVNISDYKSAEYMKVLLKVNPRMLDRQVTVIGPLLIKK